MVYLPHKPLQIMPKYIYQSAQWPHFTWNDLEINLILGKVRHLQGKIVGQMATIGFSEKEETSLTNLTLDVLKSSEIEGEVCCSPKIRQ